ncbi:MAG: hypothetical protein PUF97_00345 [Bifidobacteriaceae bacterium]|nr:hypothetical protein [Bifidobacteriaceae bacterium]
MGSSYEDLIMTIIAVILLTLGVVIVVSFIVYILQGVWGMTLLKAGGYSTSAAAWVPIWNTAALARCVNSKPAFWMSLASPVCNYLVLRLTILSRNGSISSGSFLANILTLLSLASLGLYVVSNFIIAQGYQRGLHDTGQIAMPLLAALIPVIWFGVASSRIKKRGFDPYAARREPYPWPMDSDAQQPQDAWNTLTGVSPQPRKPRIPWGMSLVHMPDGAVIPCAFVPQAIIASPQEQANYTQYKNQLSYQLIPYPPQEFEQYQQQMRWQAQQQMIQQQRMMTHMRGPMHAPTMPIFAQMPAPMPIYAQTPAQMTNYVQQPGAVPNFGQNNAGRPITPALAQRPGMAPPMPQPAPTTSRFAPTPEDAAEEAALQAAEAAEASEQPAAQKADANQQVADAAETKAAEVVTVEADAAETDAVEADATASETSREDGHMTGTAETDATAEASQSTDTTEPSEE